MDDESKKTNMTFRVEKNLRAEFDRAAKANDRTGAQLLREFMRKYIQRHAVDTATNKGK